MNKDFSVIRARFDLCSRHPTMSANEEGRQVPDLGEASDDPRPSGRRQVGDVASIGHDLNNLLSVIVASAQLVRACADVSDDLKAALDDMYEAGLSAAKLTRQLVSIAAGGAASGTTVGHPPSGPPEGTPGG
jgi:hypothetical protein